MVGLLHGTRSAANAGTHILAGVEACTETPILVGIWVLLCSILPELIGESILWHVVASCFRIVSVSLGLDGVFTDIAGDARSEGALTRHPINRFTLFHAFVTHGFMSVVSFDESAFVFKTSLQQITME